jgi:hypothetical protein
MDTQRLGLPLSGRCGVANRSSGSRVVRRVLPQSILREQYLVTARVSSSVQGAESIAFYGRLHLLLWQSSFLPDLRRTVTTAYPQSCPNTQ